MIRRKGYYNISITINYPRRELKNVCFYNQFEKIVI